MSQSGNESALTQWWKHLRLLLLQGTEEGRSALGLSFLLWTPDHHLTRKTKQSKESETSVDKIEKKQKPEVLLTNICRLFLLLDIDPEQRGGPGGGGQLPITHPTFKDARKKICFFNIIRNDSLPSSFLCLDVCLVFSPTGKISGHSPY